MIKSEVKEKEVKETKPFPKLMIYGGKRDIILLATKRLEGNKMEGVVVGGGYYQIGHIDDCWSFEKFEDFHGSITLTQE